MKLPGRDEEDVQLTKSRCLHTTTTTTATTTIGAIYTTATTITAANTITTTKAKYIKAKISGNAEIC